MSVADHHDNDQLLNEENIETHTEGQNSENRAGEEALDALTEVIAEDIFSFIDTQEESSAGSSAECMPDTDKKDAPIYNCTPDVNKDTAEACASYRKAKERLLSEATNYITAMLDDINVRPDNADTRFSTALPLNRVRTRSVAIVGAGGLGNWQWRALLGMGFQDITIFDDDTVGIENVGPQAHSIFDLGVPKVQAVEEAALLSRGVLIKAINERVYTMRDIIDKMGYTPDILITCTDSAAFRNGFIEDITDPYAGYGPDSLPDLLLDYRMSLGDYTCYAIPLRLLSERGMGRTYLDNYKKRAVFPEEEAVQEACTERAIVYTGMNVASYTGAIVHWFLTTWRRKVAERDSYAAMSELVQSFFSDHEDFHWDMSYSARDWVQITPTAKEERLTDKLIQHKERVFILEGDIVNLFSDKYGRSLSLVRADDIQPADYIVLDSNTDVVLRVVELDGDFVRYVIVGHRRILDYDYVRKGNIRYALRPVTLTLMDELYERFYELINRSRIFEAWTNEGHYLEVEGIYNDGSLNTVRYNPGGVDTNSLTAFDLVFSKPANAIEYHSKNEQANEDSTLIKDNNVVSVDDIHEKLREYIMGNNAERPGGVFTGVVMERIAFSDLCVGDLVSLDEDVNNAVRLHRVTDDFAYGSGKELDDNGEVRSFVQRIRRERCNTLYRWALQWAIQ